MTVLRAIDADTHYYETQDCFSRFAEPVVMERGPNWRKGADGTEALFIGDRPFTFLKDPTFARMAPPGSLAEMLRRGVHQVDSGMPGEVPAAAYVTDRDARVELLDTQRVRACVLCPTLGITFEHMLRDDVEATYASLRAFNNWLDDQWGFDYKGRLLSVPLLSLIDVDEAVKELERVLAMGARVVHLRPGPQGGRSPADLKFDPFWARINEAGIPVAFHIAESGYNEFFSTAFGEEPNPTSHEQSAWQWTNTFGDRPMLDTMSALIFGNLFGRFPNVRVVSIENGSLWVGYLLKQMDKMKGMGRPGPWPGGFVKGRPSEIFKQHVFVSPYFEEDLVALSQTIGASQILFGSDHPHTEGLPNPLSFEDSIADLSKTERDQIMSGNSASLFGVDFDEMAS